MLEKATIPPLYMWLGCIASEIRDEEEARRQASLDAERTAAFHGVLIVEGEDG
jgi:hypothetical protein